MNAACYRASSCTAAEARKSLQSTGSKTGHILVVLHSSHAVVVVVQCKPHNAIPQRMH